MTAAFKIIDSFDAYLKVVHEEFPRTNGNRLYYRGQGKRAEEGFDLKPSVARYPHLEKLQLAEGAPALKSTVMVLVPQTPSLVSPAFA